MATRHPLPLVLTLLLLAPVLPMPVAGASTWDHVSFNLNQRIVQPGEQAWYSLNGPAGEVTLRVDRLLDPAEVRDFSVQDDGMRRETALTRSIRLSDATPHGGWGSVYESFALEQPGIYLVEATRGQVSQRDWLQVAPHSFVLKAGPAQALLYAFRLADGAPLEGARVLVRGAEVGVTDAEGLLPFDRARLTGPVLVLDAEGAPSAGQLAPWDDGSRPMRFSIQMDRPVYRPGHTVHLKAVAFEPSGDRLVPSDAEAIRVRVVTWARGAEETVREETLRPNGHGSVALSFPLREDAPLGSYNVEVSTPEGHKGWASFEVEAYRKPRIKVDVETARDAYVQGDEVLVRASASWFFGAPLGRGQVSYAVSGVSPYYSWDDCAVCGISLESSLVPPGYGRVEHASGTGELRDDGTFTFSYKPTGPIEAPVTVEATVTVTAESGEQQEGRATFVLHPSRYALSLLEGPYAYSPDEPIEVAALVLGLSGEPVAGVPVTFRLGEERGDARVVAEAVTDADGQARVTMRQPATGGGYMLVASAKDAEGRETLARRWLWLSHDATGWSGGGDLRVLPERDSYEPGETARVRVLASRPMHVLVTLEDADLRAWRLVRVDGSALVELPIGAAQSPMTLVSASAIQPAQPGGGPWLARHEATIKVGPDPRALNVTLTPEKPAYRDGDETRLLVQVRDAQGRPVVGEVGLAVVDESIFRLRERRDAPIHEQVYPFERRVSTHEAWWSLGGRVSPVALAEAPLGRTASLAFDASGADPFVYKASGEPSVRVREDFSDTALWLPFLRTDANGTARVRLTAPDTLTEWRVTGRAHTTDGLVGEGAGAFHTRKPLMVELVAPRFLVQGDSLNVSAIVFNHLGELRDVEVQLVGEGAAKLAGSGYRRVTLSEGDSARVDFPILATDDPSALANLTVVVASEGAVNATDAMRLRLPVLAHGVVEKAVRAGVDDASIVLPLPAGPYAAPPSLTVTLSPGVAGAVLDALPYLLGFPYGCVEQTMSRFMPAVVATRALVDAGYDAQDPKLPEYVDGGLARLMRFQHADGGWGWWETDETHPYMTAYVVAGLSEAKRAGAKVDEDAMRRGVEALRLLYAKQREPDMRAYQAYALALAGAPPSAWPSESEVSADGLALLGLGKLAAGDETGATSALDRLMEKAIREEGTLHWSATGERWGHSGIRSDVQLTAQALRLLVGLGRDQDAPLAVSWLAQQRAGAWWATTKDTAESVLAIVEYLQTTDELNPDFDAVVTVGGKTFRVPFHEARKELQRERIVIPLPADATGPVSVKLERQGAGRLYWSAALSSTPRAEVIEAADRGFAVTKRILDKDGREARHLAFNEEYTVSVSVATGSTRSHVLLHDALPAGVEVVKDEPSRDGWMPRYLCMRGCGGGGWGWPWSNVEVRDDHVAAFATTLQPGTATLAYRVRAVTPGSYHVLPATVEEMYAPGVFGRSGDLHVSVGDVPRLLLGDALITETALTLRVFGLPLDGRPSVRLLDPEGLALPGVEERAVTWLDDGSALLEVASTAPLPAVFSVAVWTPETPPVARTFDRTGEPVRFPGAFSEPALAAWSAGPVVDAREATARSGPADPDVVFERHEPRPLPPGPVDQETPPTAQPPVEPTRSGPLNPVPAVAPAVVVALAAGLALAMGRRRR